MLEVTEYMVDYVNNNIMDSAVFTKDEIKVFETFTDLAMYLYDRDLQAFLSDLEDEIVMNSDLSLLDNFFYEYHGVFQDESYEYIYLLQA